MTFTDKVNCHELAGAFAQRSPVKVQAHMVCCSFVCVACLRLCFNGRRSGHLFEQLRRLFLCFSTAWWLLYFNTFLATFVHHAYNEQQHVHVDSTDYFAIQLSQQLVNFEFYVDCQSPASTSTSTSTVTPASPSFLTASSVDNNTLYQAI